MRAAFLGVMLLLAGCHTGSGLRPEIGNAWLLLVSDGTGSCFPVASFESGDGWDVLFLTARHMTAAGSSYEIFDVGIAELVATHPDRDIAILRVWSAKRLDTYRLSFRKTERGERVYLAGWPMGHGYFVKDGLICGEDSMSVPLHFGDSGGPLFRQNGDVVGVARGHLSNGHRSMPDVASFSPIAGLSGWFRKHLRPR